MTSSEIEIPPGNPLDRVLALDLPWSILAGFLPAVLALIRRLLPNAILPGALSLGIAIFVPALLVSAAVTLYLEFLDPQTSHSSAHLRGAVLAGVAAYIIASLLSFRPALGLPGIGLIFFPGLRNTTAALAALYIWIFVIYLRDIFHVRELFEDHTRRYSGEDLRRVMLEDSSIMTGAEEQTKKMVRFYSVQLGFIFLLVLICSFLRAPLALFNRILTMIILAAAAMIFSLLNLFSQEQFFAGEGIAVPAFERRKRLGAGILFCAAAALLAALGASDNNILPISLLLDLLARLAAFFARPDRPVLGPIEMPQMEAPMVPSADGMAQMLGLQETEPWPFWDYLPYIALGLIIAAFLWFMIKPIFTFKPGSGKLPFILRVARLFKGGFAGLKLALKNFFASLGVRGAAIKFKVSDGDLHNMAQDLLANWSGARKRELRQSLNLFARLILWGTQTHQCPWKPSLAPGEYCAALSAAVRAFAVDEGATAEILRSVEILRCGEIFEEALYGPRPPDKKTQREFRDLVEGITG
jgi:hypothetical protein